MVVGHSRLFISFLQLEASHTAGLEVCSVDSITDIVFTLSVVPIMGTDYNIHCKLKSEHSSNQGIGSESVGRQPSCQPWAPRNVILYHSQY